MRGRRWETAGRRKQKSKNVIFSSQSYPLEYDRARVHYILFLFPVAGIYSRCHVRLLLLKLSLLWNADSIIFFLKRRVTSSEVPFHYLLCNSSPFSSFPLTLKLSISHSVLAIFQYEIYVIHNIFLKMKTAHLKGGETDGENGKGKVGECCGVSDNECEGCGNLMTFQTSAPDRRRNRLMKQTHGEKLLPSLGHGAIVHGFHSQSEAPPDSELNTWCHSNDPGAVEKHTFITQITQCDAFLCHTW